jgi:hypothetical protein
MKRWWEERNTKSLDGLHGLVSAHVTDQVFQPSTNTPTHADMWNGTTPSSFYQKLPNKLGVPVVDFKLIVAFLLGVMLASSYGRFIHAMQYFLMNVKSSFSS